MSAFAEATIGTERLLLTPLRIADADEMVDVLADPRLHQFIGGRPATLGYGPYQPQRGQPQHRGGTGHGQRVRQRL